MANGKKSARFNKVAKRNGKGETWTYFVPGQNVDSVKSDAEQQHVATAVTFHGWHEVSVEIDHDGVYFSAIIDGGEWVFRPRDEGYDFLTVYLKIEYDDANRSYHS
jgi:hypothetical protein